MWVIKLYKTGQLYEISTVNVQTRMNKLLWYMCKWSTVYIKNTHLSLSCWLCVFQVCNRCCLCMEEWWRNFRRYVRSDIIQRNLRRRKWRLSAKSSADFLYENWHYMYVHVSLISDRYILSLKNFGACRYWRFSFDTFLFRQQVFLAVRSGKWRKSK